MIKHDKLLSCHYNRCYFNLTDDEVDKSNAGISPQNSINQNTNDEINSLQRNFERYSISNTANHNHVAGLGSRSSLSSGEFLTTMTLGRKNSNNSLQYSSGYSSQHSTPACSEDTIASHGNCAQCSFNFVYIRLDFWSMINYTSSSRRIFCTLSICCGWSIILLIHYFCEKYK